MLDQRTDLEAQVAKLQSEVNSMTEAATSGAKAPTAEIESFKVALKVVQEANEHLVATKASLEVQVEQLVASVAALQLNSDGAASKIGKRCFVSGHGATDYGAALSFTIQDCRERRGEGVLVATDIKGAFDRCWWRRTKNRLKAKGIRRRALYLFRDYLFNRFIEVVAVGCTSSRKQIFSGVPQGGKWSSTLWDLDISEMCDSLSDLVLPLDMQTMCPYGTSDVLVKQ